MKVYIHGHGTLAAATRACVAKHFDLAPAGEADVNWLCADTPVNSLDESNIEAILEDARSVIRQLPPKALVLISSQIPVGTTAILEGEFPEIAFAYSPENIRVATAIADFEKQARIVLGMRPEKFPLYEHLLKPLLIEFTNHLIVVNIETAEMVKHTLNGYLAMCIAYINEIDTICRKVGADPDRVSECLMLEPRVSPKAPLKPGAPYGLGHLARDVHTMTKLGGVLTPLIASLKISNDRVIR